MSSSKLGKSSVSDHDTLELTTEGFETPYLVKQVFPTFEFLGWYSVGPIPLQVDMDIHKQVGYFMRTEYYRPQC